MRLVYDTTLAQDKAIKREKRLSNPTLTAEQMPSDKDYAVSMIEGLLNAKVAEQEAARQSTINERLKTATEEERATIESALGIATEEP